MEEHSKADGAVFSLNNGKALGPGVLRAKVGDEVFEFRSE